MGGNLLTDESAFELRNKLICDYNQVKKLYLDGNDIGLQGAKLLLECERLEVIYLNHNSLLMFLILLFHLLHMY